MGTLFVSYRRTHSQAIDAACALLESEGVHIFLDRVDVEPMGEFPQRIRDAISDSHAMLVWWSEDYAESEVCMDELRLAWRYARRRSHRVGQRVWIVNPEAGVQHIHAGDLSGQNYLRPPTLETGVEWARLIAAKLAELEQTGPLSEGCMVAAAVELHGVPLPPRFVGRGKECLQIHSAAFPAEVSAAAASPLVQLCGMPGIGKSALAVHYAHTFADAFPGGVWWFDMGSTLEVDSPETLLDRWLDAARQQSLLDSTGMMANALQGESGYELTATEVRSRFFRLLDRTLGPVLWVLNDFPLVRRADIRDRALELLRLPMRRGLTLVTSRDARPMPASTVLTLHELSELQAARLLGPEGGGSMIELDAAAVRDLASAVGGHPLAITLLREYASTQAVPLERIRQQIADRGTLRRLEEIYDLMQTDLGESVRSIVSAFEISTRPFREDLNARSLLALVCACAPGKAIPVELLAAAFGGESREDEFHRALSALQRASLLDRPPHLQRCIAIHVILLQVAVQLMDLDTTSARKTITGVLVQRMQGLDQSAGAFVELLSDVPHAESILATLEGPDALRLSAGVARVHLAAGRPSAAMEMAQKAVEILHSGVHTESREALNARLTLSLAIAQLGDLSQAASMQFALRDEALEILGSDDDDTLTIGGHLADTLAQLNHFDQSERLLRELLAALTSRHGQEHRDTVSARSDLAGLLYQRGRFTEALALQRQVRSAVEELHGPATADYLIVTSNLAMTELAMGRVEDAIRLQAHAMQIGKGVLGHAHPVLRACMTALGDSFIAAGEVDMAQALYERVHAVTSAALGERHPETVMALSRVVGSRAAGPVEFWSTEVADFIAIAESTVSAGHPLVHQAVEHLVDALHACRAPLAPFHQLLAEVLAARTRDLGVSDAQTLRAASNLSIVLGEKGLWSEVVELRRQVLEGTVRVFGQYEPPAIQKMAELAEALQLAGHTAEAGRMLAMAEDCVARYVRSRVGH